MGKYLILMLLFPVQTFAEAPECPIQKNKRSCIASVEKNYYDGLEFIEENTNKENPERDELIRATLDIKKYETLACQKTCLN